MTQNTLLPFRNPLEVVHLAAYIITFLAATNLPSLHKEFSPFIFLQSFFNISFIKHVLCVLVIVFYILFTLL